MTGSGLLGRDDWGPGAGREGQSKKGQKATSDGGVQEQSFYRTTQKATPVERGLGPLRRRYEPQTYELDKESAEIITAALNHATVDECKRAIDGCAASPFHMGQNDKRRKFNGLSQILKGKRAGGPRSTAVTTRERIDFFIDIAEKAHIAVDPEGERLAKQYVRDAWEFPGDSDVVERGEEGVRWLAEHGIKVTEDPSDTNRLGTPRPRFVVA